MFAPALLAGLVAHAAAAVIFVVLMGLPIACDTAGTSSYFLTIAVGLDLALTAVALVTIDRRWGIDRHTIGGWLLSLLPAVIAFVLVLNDLAVLPTGCAP